MENNNINNIHDKFFKAIMSNENVAIDFFKTFLPKKIVAMLDFGTLKLTQNSFVSGKLHESFADLVFECKLSNTNLNAFISILLEHKSNPDKYSYVQLLGYMVQGYQSQIKSGKPLKPILPMLLYQGKDKWELKPLSKLIPGLHPDLLKYIPQFDIEFIDLKNFSDEELFDVGNTFLSSALTIQKYSQRPIELINKINNIFGALFPEEMGNFSKVLFVYYLQLVDIKEDKLLEIIEKIPDKTKNEIMSTYELIEQKGIEKGIEKGIQKGIQKKTIDVILKGHKNGISINILATITGISTQEVQKIIEENSN